MELHKLAEILDSAAKNATATPQLTLSHPHLSVEDAYKIQAISIGHRYDRGERPIGVKMGLTSRAKMKQVGVDEVIWGRLTHAMLLEEGGHLNKSNYVHPRIEPEIAFLLNKPLKGEITALEALDAVEAIAPAMEIIDSRYENFKFSLPDVIADNSSSSGLVIGSWFSKQIDISNIGMVMSVDGRAVEIGSSAAILGNPVRALVAAARMVAQSGEQLNAGDIVLAGAATAAYAVSVGETIKLEVQDLGFVSISVEA